MYIDINEFMKLSREERRKHLDLSEDCLEIGGSSTQFKGVLSHYLKVTIPENYRILMCHACCNAKCSNPKHLYYGTHKDNTLDEIEQGRFKSIWQKQVEKYGEDEARKRRSEHSNGSNGGKSNTGKPKSEKHKKHISEGVLKQINNARVS